MNKKDIIIAIDGFSSCGKSTLAKAMAEKLGYIFIDSGAMYRAVTLYFIQQNVDLDNEKEVEQALSEINISFVRNENGNQTFLNGQNVETEIRKMAVSELVSPVATISAVRRKLVEQQRKMGMQKGIVMDGRDIGTVVFPEASLKIFLTANVEVRSERRYLELKNKGMAEITKAEVANNLKERDRIDSGRKDSPLMQAKDAVVIDNTNLKPEEQLAMVLTLANLRETE